MHLQSMLSIYGFKKPRGEILRGESLSIGIGRDDDAWKNGERCLRQMRVYRRRRICCYAGRTILRPHSIPPAMNLLGDSRRAPS